MSGLFSNITLSKYHLEKCPVFLSIQFSLHTSDKGKINRKKSTPMIIAVMIFLFLNSYDVPKIHINSSVESLFSVQTRVVDLLQIIQWTVHKVYWNSLLAYADAAQCCLKLVCSCAMASAYVVCSAHYAICRIFHSAYFHICQYIFPSIE